MTSFNPDDLLNPSSGAPALKFTDIGDTHKGTVVAKEARQQTDFATGQALFWDDGKPRMEVVFTLLLEDGTEGRLFARGQILNAIREAIKEAKATTVDIGGTLAVQHTGTEPSATKGFSPKKLYAAAYRPPAVKAADDLIAPAAAPVTSASLI